MAKVGKVQGRPVSVTATPPAETPASTPAAGGSKGDKGKGPKAFTAPAGMAKRTANTGKGLPYGLDKKLNPTTAVKPGGQKPVSVSPPPTPIPAPSAGKVAKPKQPPTIGGSTKKQIKKGIW